MNTDRSIPPENELTIEDNAELHLPQHSLRFGLQTITAGFLCNFMVFGIGFSYGVLQEFYGSSTGPLYNYSEAKIALIGTIGNALIYLCAIFNKTLMFYMCSRNVMLLGCAVLSLGLVLTGFASSYYQFVLCSILQGAGGSILYLPPVVCAPAYFDKHRSLAMGFLFSGTGVGAFSIALFTRYLLEAVGWKWTLRTLGLINLAVGSFASVLVVEPQIPGFKSNANGLLNLSQVRSGKITLQLLGSLLQSAGYLMPLIFMSKYAVSLGFSSSQGALFIGINNLVNAGSKIFIGSLADTFGRLNTLIVCSVLSAAFVFGLWLPGLRETFLALVVLYGVFSGAIISLLPSILIEIFGMNMYSQLSGILIFARGVGVIIGSPIGATLIVANGARPKDYVHAIIYNGALLAASAVCLTVLWASVGRSKKTWKI
ncbi:putative transporter MCH4 [Candida viswanathii]|uniref:Putative transporter MCH4 n=1 Tax=Candida viswanathii TaxID=5486 RepID=A0A367YJ52_9ASCO|nr:putative transporter MCH4 [Candida viswanathii]